MFTGIIEEMGELVEREGSRYTFRARKVLRGLREGDSIAVNGACLTLTGRGRERFTVDITPETARRTTFGSLRPGDPVNLERPLRYGGRVGGHLVQGHIDGTGQVLSLAPEGDAYLFRFEAPASLQRYIVEKGFIAVDGVSLTVVSCDATSFTVSVIPYTYRNTTLGRRQPGDPVNLEVDILAKYLERLLQGGRR